MNRYKFRGKHIETGEWVYGCYNYLKFPLGEHVDHFIVVDGFQAVAVDPETVGQWTGLNDERGIEIYSGSKCRLFGEESYMSESISTDYDWELEGEVILYGGCFWVRVDKERKIDIPLSDVYFNEIGIEVMNTAK